MASLLRQIVAGPRLQHPEAGLDLCYVTDLLIATSGPSSTYPQRAYRNPTDALVRFLDSKHGENWSIWEFRAEGTGYPDSEVYGRIHHFPWPDHHPPPFALIPAIMASMRNWLGARGTDKMEGKHSHHKQKRVAVVHCKAGKGRSGTIACSYLISQEGWKMEDAMRRFTERRMRVGFGDGVSIPSQIRWVKYVNRWANQLGKVYVERPVEILEVHVWGLRDGVKIAVEGYVDEGKKIKSFHLFRRRERIVVDGGKNGYQGNGDSNPPKEGEDIQKKTSTTSSISSSSIYAPAPPTETVTTPESSGQLERVPAQQISAIILRPEQPIILPTSDVNIDFERRTKAAYTGWAMVTSIAHVWFNPYFEGGDQNDSGAFECEWEGLDGIKGSTRKGTKALERLKVVWRYASSIQAEGKAPGKVIALPKPGEPVPETHAADWRGENNVALENGEGVPENNALYSAIPSASGNLAVEVPKERNSSIMHRLSRKNDNTEPNESRGLTGESYPIVAEAATATATAANAAVKSFNKLGKELGLRKQTAASRDISLASSVEDLKQQERQRNEEQQGLSTGKGKKKKKKTGEEEEGEDTDMGGVRPYYKDENGEDKSKDADSGTEIGKADTTTTTNN